MAGKWITQGKGSDAKHIMVKGKGPTADLEEDVRTTPIMEYPFPDPEVESLKQAISQLYTDTDEELHYLLHVREVLLDLEPTFTDQEAFEELMDMVEVIFDSFVQLKQRIRNLNNRGVSGGFSTKYIKTRLDALTKENNLLREYFERLPQADTPRGRDLVRSEDIILGDLEQSGETVSGLADFQGVAIPDDNQRDSRDFEHLKKGAINRYVLRKKIPEQA